MRIFSAHNKNTSKIVQNRSNAVVGLVLGQTNDDR
jgi:hypothetical protein